MNSNYVGVFDAYSVYSELPANMAFSHGITTTLLQRVAIAYLIEKECYVEYNTSVKEWYQGQHHRMQGYDLNAARAVFHQCFDYFLFGAMNFDNIHLQFRGATVFVSNFNFSLKSLNRGH